MGRLNPDWIDILPSKLKFHESNIGLKKKGEYNV